jgi:hypothetical protein
MTSEQLEALPQTASEPASGTLVSQKDNAPKETGLVSSISSASHTETTLPTNENGGEEQALESHEVIELQTFSERKAWIEEKIKVSSPGISQTSFPVA